MKRWHTRPEGSNWGEFGDDDQVGRLNLITPERRRVALAEAREGIVFSLSLPLDYPKCDVMGGARQRPHLCSTALGHNHHVWPAFTDVACDDSVTMSLQYSTQWDAFAHVGAMFDADGDGKDEIRYYNGYRGGEDVIGDAAGSVTPQAKALGIDTIAQTCVQGRGVMVDLFPTAGLDRVPFGYDRLMRIMEQQKATIEPGDILCLHTGLGQLVLDLGDKITWPQMETSCAALDGRDEHLLRWISDSGLAAIAADNVSVEDWRGHPEPGEKAALPLHHHCLFKLGVPLGELWYLSDLAAWLRTKGRSRFLLTAPPLRLPGAVGSPVTPVATV